MKLCPKCGGQGYIEVITGFSLDSRTYESIQCTECNGAGKVEEDC